MEVMNCDWSEWCNWCIVISSGYPLKSRPQLMLLPLTCGVFRWSH